MIKVDIIKNDSSIGVASLGDGRTNTEKHYFNSALGKRRVFVLRTPIEGNIAVARKKMKMINQLRQYTQSSVHYVLHQDG